MNQLPIRRLKKMVRGLLGEPEFDPALEKILALPPRRAVNPLFSFLYDKDSRVRWRAVTALGAVTAALADSDTESARVVFRRLMWNLNDESGGIGWGSPEVMGEIVARHPKMRSEYLSILLSYLRPDGNFLEHEGLQQGVLWAVGRVAQADSEAVHAVSGLVEAHLSSENPGLRGTAAWACGCMAERNAAEHLQALTDDPAGLELWIDQQLCTLTVGEAATHALAKLKDTRFAGSVKSRSD
jgi:HEAT repeat protein